MKLKLKGTTVIDYIFNFHAIIQHLKTIQVSKFYVEQH